MFAQAEIEFEGPSAEIRFYRADGAYGFLSNLFVRDILFEGRLFPASEYAYQAGKPNKAEIVAWLMAAPKARLCAAAAHGLTRYDVDPDWTRLKLPRMKRVLIAKFTQHHELANQLLDTGDARLIEESSTDAYWGVGARGTGQNMLGVCLMELRGLLQRSLEDQGGYLPDAVRTLAGINDLGWDYNIEHTGPLELSGARVS